MRARTGQLERALYEMTAGVQQGMSAREKSLVDAKTGEYDQQIRVPLNGTAGSAWTFVDKTVNWELAFVYSPLMRRVPFGTPHFTPGFEFISTPTDLIVLNAHILAWTITPEGWYAGATIRFGACAPNANDPIPFNASAHLTFQGYATTVESSEFQT